MSAGRARLVGDRGQVAGIETLALGLLTFVVGGLLAANAWAVVDARMAVSAAAREAARTYVEAPDGATAARRADEVARVTLAGRGRGAEEAEVAVTGGPWRRCARVMVTVRYPVPVLTLPFVGGYGRAFEAAGTHSELIDPYRAGLPAGGRC